MSNEDAVSDVAFSFGSNIGDKAEMIRRAAALLRAPDAVPDLVMSSFYRTAPWGHVLEQDWFVNACGVGHTRLLPDQLLDRCKAIERQVGRRETRRWGPRVIDIDVLCYDSSVVDTPRLTIPHREMLRRAFVLVPLADLQPDRVIAGMTVRDALAAVDRTGIELYPDAS